MKDVKVKDENKESIHKDAIENCIEEAQSIIKKIKKIYDKTQYKHEKGSSKSQIKTLEFSELDLLERSLFGITNKEIKDVNSQIKKYERSMPKHMFEIKAANKFSPV